METCMRNALIALEEWVMDDVFFIFIAKALLIVGIPIILLVAFLAHLDSKDPHISLNKTEWSCTHTHTFLMPVSTGKTVVLIPQEVCDTYRMNGYQ
jgi:hypothetical protein